MAETHSTATGRSLVVLECLSEDPLTPITNAALARKSGLSKMQVSRALQDLEGPGWVEHVDAGGWRLTPRLTQIAYRVQLAIASAHRNYLTG